MPLGPPAVCKCVWGHTLLSIDLLNGQEILRNCQIKLSGFVRSNGINCSNGMKLSASEPAATEAAASWLSISTMNGSSIRVRSLKKWSFGCFVRISSPGRTESRRVLPPETTCGRVKQTCCRRVKNTVDVFEMPQTCEKVLFLSFTRLRHFSHVYSKKNTFSHVCGILHTSTAFFRRRLQYFCTCRRIVQAPVAHVGLSF